MTNIFEKPEEIPEEEMTVEDVVFKLNELLREKASESAERAFSVSCLMSIFIVGAIAVIVLFISHWLTSVVIITFGGLVGLGVSSFLSYQSRAGNLVLTYQKEIEPKIPLILAEYGLGTQEFNDLVFHLLPEEAPLVIQIKQQTPGSE